MRKADYRHISVSYDVSRHLSEENLELWIELISQKISSYQKVDFLDLGCGTGRFSIPIAIKLGYSVTGADISKEMILKAREKKGESQVRWVIEDSARGTVSADNGFNLSECLNASFQVTCNNSPL